MALLDGVADAERRPQRALRIVAVRARRAEDRHDRVADVLLDRPAVALDLGGDRLEVRALDLSDILGVARLGPAREADHVDEEDGDEAAFLGDGHARILPRDRKVTRVSGRRGPWR